MSEHDEDEIRRRSAEAFRHQEYTPGVRPEVDAVNFRRVEIKLNPFPSNVRQTPYGPQNDNGSDVSLIRSNLRMTPTERVIQADRMTDEALYIRRNVRRIA